LLQIQSASSGCFDLLGFREEFLAHAIELGNVPYPIYCDGRDQEFSKSLRIAAEWCRVRVV
jgi:hypothetical protein